MSYAVLTIQSDGTISTTIQPKRPDLAQLQASVGGYIALVPQFSRFEYDNIQYTHGELYANEEGLIKNLPFNKTATDAWRKELDRVKMRYSLHGTRLVGNCVFVAKVKE